METYKYIALINHLSDKNENYIERYLVGLSQEIKTIEEVDTLSKEHFNKLLELRSKELEYSKEFKTEFEVDGTVYKVLSESELTVEHFIEYENALNLNQSYFKLIIPIFSILTGIKDKEFIKNLDHSIVMPVVDFFLSIQNKLKPSSRKFIQQVQAMNQVKHTQLQSNEGLTKLLHSFSDYYMQLPMEVFYN